MRRVTSFLILTAASALLGCASQAPATSTATDSGQVKAAVTSNGAAAAQPNAAATSNGTATAQAHAAPTSTAADSGQTSGQIKQSVQVTSTPFEVPGWRRVVRDGHELYCQTSSFTGSRVNAQETCLTKPQLEQMQQHSEQAVDQLEREEAVK